MESDNDGWRGFLKLCLMAKSEKELDELFWLMLTHEEREDIKDRFRIVQEIVRGEKTQREMSKDLGVSIAKITRGSNCIKQISKNLRRLFS
jgi:TrpR family trp operon transcriptional repressor